MHILCYTDAPGLGGAEISLARLLAHLPGELRLSLVGTNSDLLDAIRPPRDVTVRCLDDQARFSTLHHWRTFTALRPDIIHVNACTPWECQPALQAALWTPGSTSGARVVRVDQLVLRTVDVNEMRRVRGLCRRLDAHVAVGEASARQMENYYLLGRGSIRTIHNSAPARQTPPPLPPIRERPLALAVGRLDAMKGHEVLLRALAQVDGVELAIAGEGDERASLERLAQELGLSERVEFLGWVEEVRPLLDGCNFFVQPSRSEGFSLAIVEAMLAGRAIIATDVGSTREAIRHGETGLLLAKDDVDGLADALRHLRDQPGERRRLGERARLLAEREFTSERMAAQYVALWREVMAQPRVSRLSPPAPKA